MRSIAARLAVWYALAATATLAGLSVAGYFALQNSLINGLDLLNAAEFQQIQARLGADYRSLEATAIDQRIRSTSDYASVLFYIDIHGGSPGTLFRSSNLRGNSIPDLPGQRAFIAFVPGIGELRSAEFLLPPFDVMIGTPMKPVRDVMLGFLQISAALVTIMLLISGAIGFVLSHFALRPVRLIEETANRIRSDNLGERIAIENVDDEVANLARFLNQMFDRLESSFTQVRRFTAEASHELKTPLSLLRLHAERLIVEGTLSPVQEEAVHAQLDEVTRLNKIIEELLFISRAEAGAITLERKDQDPAAFLHGFAQDARVLSEHRAMRYSDDHHGQGSAFFDAKWLRQVLLNILANALKVSPPGGTVSLQSKLSGPSWRVSIMDEGPGVEPKSLDRIFERFVRLGPQASEPGSDNGSGLGLAICRSIIELHQGRIWAEPGANERGLRVMFEIPRQALSVSETTSLLRAQIKVASSDSGRQQQWHSD